MSKVFRASAVLICSNLVSLLVSSAWMVNYVQWGERLAAVRHAPGPHFLCENFVHAVGFADITLGAVGLLVVFFPFRRREPWSWLALAILFGAYSVPVVLHSVHLPPNWATLAAGMRGPGPSREVLWNTLFPTLMLIGLLLSLPSFIRRRGAAGPDAR